MCSCTSAHNGCEKTFGPWAQSCLTSSMYCKVTVSECDLTNHRKVTLVDVLLKTFAKRFSNVLALPQLLEGHIEIN